MLTRLSRFAAFIVITAMVFAAPLSAVASDIEATPATGQPTEESTPADSDTEDEGEATESPTATSDADGIETDESSVGPQAIAGTFTLNQISWSSDELTVPLVLDAGFSAASGDSVTLYFGWYDNSGADFTLGGLTSTPSVNVSVTVTSSTIDVTFPTGFTASATATPLELVFDAPVTFDACHASPNGYDQYIDIGVYKYNPYSDSSVEVSGDHCDGVGLPVIEDVELDLQNSTIEFEVALPEILLFGMQATVTWPTDDLDISLGTYDVTAYNNVSGQDELVGVVEVTPGLITFSIIVNGDIDEWDSETEINLPVTIPFTCEPGDTIVETGELYFQATPGTELRLVSYPILCGATAPTKIGVFGEDEGGQFIQWTIDTGVQFGDVHVDDHAPAAGFEFNCDEGVNVEIYSGVLSYYDCFDDNQGIEFGFYSEDTVHAEITMKTYLTDTTRTSYLNCAEVSAWPRQDDKLLAAAADTSTGWGGEACYELFPEGGGDAIDKTVDKATAKSGETVTYTVTAETTADNWITIDLSDTLPAGFELDEDSIVCTVSDPAFAADPCYTYDGTTLSVTATALLTDEEWEQQLESGPVTITLTFSGTVTGKEGDVITNEACSERTVYVPEMRPTLVNQGDPTIPGGGVICDSAETMIVVDPATVEPSPSPSPSPTVPGATPTEPGATATATATATQGVTGLPNTGSGQGGIGTALLWSALGMVASAAVLAGVRIRRNESDVR